MISLSLFVLGLTVQGFLGDAEGRVSLPARPPVRARGAGFVVNEPIIGGSTKKSSSSTATGPSFVSVGIRSARAREKASTVRNKDETGTSAASRLRGGSWGPGHAPIMPQVIHSAEKPKEQPPSTSSIDGNSRRQQSEGAQLVASKQRILEEPETADSYDDDEEAGGVVGGSGGGGGGRAGSLPSFPRTLPAGKAPFSKKFAWVP